MSRASLSWIFYLLAAAALVLFLNARQAPVELFKTDEERAAFMRAVGADPETRVIALVTSWCGACRAAEDGLAEAGIPFVRLDIESNGPGAALFERAVAAGTSRAIPKLVVGRFLVDRRDVFAAAAATGTPAPAR